MKNQDNKTIAPANNKSLYQFSLQMVAKVLNGEVTAEAANNAAKWANIAQRSFEDELKRTMIQHQISSKVVEIREIEIKGFDDTLTVK
jgi:hypothetical protein